MEELATICQTIEEGDVICLFKSPILDRNDHEKFVVNAITRSDEGNRECIILKDPKGANCALIIDDLLPTVKVFVIRHPKFVEKTFEEGWHFKH